MGTILEIKNLNLGFQVEDDFYQVLDNISLSFDEGKIHAIAGESGCGKSVLVSSILKLLPKNARVLSGEVLYKNKNFLVNDDKNIYRDFSLIPQDPFMSLNPLYTIQNQIFELPCLNRLSNFEKEKIALEVLDDVKIKDPKAVLKSYPHELSGGMKQRVIIAMALISDSKIIFADEPTTALDVSVSNSILKLLLDLKSKGKTIILITHDLSVVSNYADTVNVLYLGEVVEKANVKDFFINPKHPYSNALLNALPIDKNKRLKNIKGLISPFSEKIEGCKFNPRCECVLEKCKIEKPVLKKQDNSFVSCFLYD